MATHQVTLTQYVNHVYEIESDEPYEVVIDQVLEHPERYTLVSTYVDGDMDYSGYELMDNAE